VAIHVQAIADANGITNINNISVGQVLRIPDSASWIFEGEDMFACGTTTETGEPKTSPVFASGSISSPPLVQSSIPYTQPITLPTSQVIPYTQPTTLSTTGSTAPAVAPKSFSLWSLLPTMSSGSSSGKILGLTKTQLGLAAVGTVGVLMLLAAAGRRPARANPRRRR
jgi:LysM domain-containing protein